MTDDYLDNILDGYAKKKENKLKERKEHEDIMNAMEKSYKEKWNVVNGMIHSIFRDVERKLDVHKIKCNINQKSGIALELAIGPQSGKFVATHFIRYWRSPLSDNVSIDIQPKPLQTKGFNKSLKLDEVNEQIIHEDLEQFFKLVFEQ